MIKGTIGASREKEFWFLVLCAKLGVSMSTIINLKRLSLYDKTFKIYGKNDIEKKEKERGKKYEFSGCIKLTKEEFLSTHTTTESYLYEKARGEYDEGGGTGAGCKTEDYVVLYLTRKIIPNVTVEPGKIINFKADVNFFKKKIRIEKMIPSVFFLCIRKNLMFIKKEGIKISDKLYSQINSQIKFFMLVITAGVIVKINKVKGAEVKQIIPSPFLFELNVSFC